MPGPSIAKNATILVDGFDLSCTFKDLSLTKTADELDSTALCTAGHRTFVPGLKAGNMALTGFYDYDGTNLDEVGNILNTAFDAQAQLIISASLNALALNGPAFMMRGGQTSFSIESVLNQLVMTSADIRAEDNVFTGAWLFNGNATSGATAGTVIDNGAATANGGLLHAHVHLESDSTATDGTFLVEHSVDGSTSWATLVASTAVGAAKGAFVVEVAAGTTVRRHLRVTFTATGGKAYGAAAFYRA